MGLSGLLSAFVVSCAAENPAPSKMEVRKLQTEAGEITTLVPVGSPGMVEKIIGENELTPVLNDGANIPERYRSLINGFGRMSMGCTATHIGDGLVISAGHCFEAPPNRTNNAKCDGIKVEWGVRKDKPAYLTSNCEKILAYETSDDRDYAIFKVDKAPPVKLAVDLSGRPRTDTKITIFGFPQLRPLEWSKTCAIKPGSGNAGQSQDWGVDQFSHQCDTEPGNSGSTVLDDDSLVVVGIHDGGLLPWNYGTYLVDTPLAEILGNAPTPRPTVQPTVRPTVQPTPQPTIVPTVRPTPGRPDIVAGPFGNNSRIELASFSRQEGRSVSFTIETDTESGRDLVIVSSSDGFFGRRTQRMSGAKTRFFGDLKTPVTVTFVSDEEVRSEFVAIREIAVRR